LDQARQALEAYVENREDRARLNFCLTYVHQVHGTLRMVELHGAALLTEEMERLTQALLDGSIGEDGEALQVLMQATLPPPAYLGRVHASRSDQPLLPLGLRTGLRRVRGDQPLPETGLFSPELSLSIPPLPPEALAQLDTPE